MLFLKKNLHLRLMSNGEEPPSPASILKKKAHKPNDAKTKKKQKSLNLFEIQALQQQQQQQQPPPPQQQQTATKDDPSAVVRTDLAGTAIVPTPTTTSTASTLSSSASSLQAKRDQLEHQREHLQAKLQALQARSSCRDTSDTWHNERLEAKQAQVDELQHAWHCSLQQQDDWQTKWQQAQDLLRESKDELNRQEQLLQECKNERQSEDTPHQAQVVAQLTAQSKTLQTALTHREASLSKYTKLNLYLQGQLDATHSKLQQLEQRHHQQEQELQAVQAQCAAHTRRVHELQTRVQELEVVVQTLDEQLVASHQAHRALQQQLEQQSQQLQQQQQQHSQQIQEWTNRVQILTHTLYERHETIAHLEDQLDHAQHSHAKSHQAQSDVIADLHEQLRRAAACDPDDATVPGSNHGNPEQQLETVTQHIQVLTQRLEHRERQLNQIWHQHQRESKARRASDKTNVTLQKLLQERERQLAQLQMQPQPPPEEPQNQPPAAAVLLYQRECLRLQTVLSHVRHELQRVQTQAQQHQQDMVVLQVQLQQERDTSAALHWQRTLEQKPAGCSSSASSKRTDSPRSVVGANLEMPTLEEESPTPAKPPRAPFTSMRCVPAGGLLGQGMVGWVPARITAVGLGSMAPAEQQGDDSMSSLEELA